MTADAGSAAKPTGWAKAWPDALAFLLGLGLAWWFQWETRDLVWGLWLSSLVIGYAMIVWGIFGPGTDIARAFRRRRPDMVEAPRPSAVVVAFLLVAGLFVLAFISVPFAGLHFLHSMFLNAFFPFEPAVKHSFPGPALYVMVFKHYWWFLPSTALAEREVFRQISRASTPPDIPLTAEVVAAPKARNEATGFGLAGLVTPGRNLYRMHLMIIFLVLAHFAKLDNFLVYAVVYAVYFFPWRLLRDSIARRKYLARA